MPKIQVYRFDLYGRYQILWTDIAHFQYEPAYNTSLCTKFQVYCSLRSDVTLLTTDGHSSNVLEFCADEVSPRNLWSQIIISRCYTRILIRAACNPYWTRSRVADRERPSIYGW